MERPSATATVPGPDYFPPDLELLCSRAALVLNEHHDAAGLCAVCGSSLAMRARAAR